MEYLIRTETKDKKNIEIWRSKCFETTLKLLHSDWSFYERRYPDFEINILECDGMNVRPIFNFDSNNYNKL